MSRKNRKKRHLNTVPLSQNANPQQTTEATNQTQTPRKPSGAAVAGPDNPNRTEFDFETFEKLCSLPKVITQDDICWIMRCSLHKCDDEIKARHPGMTFGEFRSKMGGQFRRTILDSQINAAKAGNAAILIWLGKNYLGQSDDPQPEKPDTDKKSRLIIDLSGEDVRKIESESENQGLK